MSSLAFTALMAAIAFPAMPQQSAAPAPNSPALTQTANPTPSGTTAIVPQQLRRVQPPSPTASASELEATGDELRLEKAYADALDYYRAAMRKDDSAILHDKAGIAELQMMRLQDAQHEFNKAVHLDRDYPEAYNNLGVVAYEEHRYGKAIKYYRKAIAIRELSASFHSNLGTAYFGKKEYQHAMSEYARALQLDPDIFERRSEGGISAQLVSSEDLGRYDFVIARMYASAGNPDRCLIYLQKAMEEGYKQMDSVYKDAEFTKIRKDPRFAALMNSKPVPITN